MTFDYTTVVIDCAVLIKLVLGLDANPYLVQTMRLALKPSNTSTAAFLEIQIFVSASSIASYQKCSVIISMLYCK